MKRILWKNKKLYCACALSAFILTACGDGEKNTSKQGAANAEVADSARIVSKELDVKDGFYQITNLGSPNIVYCQGNYGIWAEGDSAVLNNLMMDFDSGSLTINLKYENNPGLSMADFDTALKTTIYISCPQLKIVSVCGTGSFKAQGSIQTEALEVGTLGSGTIEFDSIRCNTLQYQQSGRGNATFGHVDCQEARFLTFGTGKMKAEVTAENNVFADASGEGTIDIRSKAKEISILSTGTGDITLDVETNLLSVESASYNTITLNGKARRKEINANPKTKLKDNLKSF